MVQEQRFDLYRDIAERTDGDVYIGVVGPVRTGKSTLITRFMEELVLPRMAPGSRRDRLSDELPQSGTGRTIMTTQPKFVPDEAVEVVLSDQATVRLRMVDSVGYLVPGALGTAENEAARMVHTPWFEQDIPFHQAAEVGTRRVMTDHATIGLVVTTDGTITELPRSAYADAEERVVREMKALGKPFVVILNSAAPRAMDTLALRDQLEEKYAVPVMLLNAKEMKVEDIQHVLESVLLEFPLREVRVDAPAWLAALDDTHWLVKHVLDGVRAAGQTPHRMRETDLLTEVFAESPYVLEPRAGQMSPGEGRLDLVLPLKEGLFTRVLGEECGTPIRSDAHLLSLMKELVQAKSAYDQVATALQEVAETGYGLVTPDVSDMTLEAPEIVKQNGQYGVRLRAHAPSLHLISVDVATEVTPVVGTEKQSEELAQFLQETYRSDPEQLWQTNFFGKSLSAMVQEDLAGKLARMPEDARQKVQETLGKMLNEGDGGMICILL